MARVENDPDLKMRLLNVAATMHLEIALPHREFKVETYRDERRYSVMVVARFTNHHGPQAVRQQCGDECPFSDFRWSDRALTEMMLLE